MHELISKHRFKAAAAICVLCAAVIAYPVASFAAIMLGWTMVRTPKANIFDGRLASARAPSLSDAVYEALWVAVAIVFGVTRLAASMAALAGMHG